MEISVSKYNKGTKSNNTLKIMLRLSNKGKRKVENFALETKGNIAS